MRNKFPQKRGGYTVDILYSWYMWFVKQNLKLLTLESVFPWISLRFFIIIIIIIVIICNCYYQNNISVINRYI